MTKVYISGIVDADAIGSPSQGPGFPTHPIAPGGPPSTGSGPGIWPSPGYPSHPIAPGGPPPNIWPSPGYPSHPIAPGGPPPGIWPGQGKPSHPIYIPVDPPEGVDGISPEHPIYIPVYPAHPIAGGGDMEESIKQAIKEFLHGNLPPSTQPVQR